jgi:DNA-binding CsgD family transcriptional regulator
VATERSRTRCRERLQLLASSTLTQTEFTDEAIRALRRAIGFDGTSCCALADPASLLPTGHDIMDADAAFHASVPRLTALHQGYEAATDRATASGQETVVTTSAITRGDLPRSQLWDECLRPHGLGDSFFLACRDRHGCWGWVNGSRGSSDPLFGAEDIRLLDHVSASLGAAMRKVTTGSESAHRDSPAPGLIICDHQLRETSWTASAHQWVALLPDGAHWQRFGLLPPAVYGIAGRLLAAGHGTSEGAARARVRTTAGSWAVLDGARLEGEAGGRVAITLRGATADEVLDIHCKIYELTTRESELVKLVVDGLNTQQLADRLFITPYTVKDHLKAVFAKTGVQSRRELVGRMTRHA